VIWEAWFAWFGARLEGKRAAGLQTSGFYGKRLMMMRDGSGQWVTSTREKLKE